VGKSAERNDMANPKEEEGFIVVSGPPPETMTGYEFDNKEEQPATQLTETPAPPSATEAPAA